MRVDIVQENNQIIPKKCKIEGNHVIVKKGHKGRGLSEWAPTFTKNALLDYETGIRPFRKMHKKLMVFHDAEACIEWDGKARVMEPATWDKRTASKWFEAKAIEQAGKVEIKQKGTWVAYITLLVVIAILFWLIFQSRGLRF